MEELKNDPSINIEGVIMARTFDEVFICGGGSVYAQTIGTADKLYLTVIEGDFEADVFFPKYEEFTKVISEREGSEGDFKYKFLELER